MSELHEQGLTAAINQMRQAMMACGGVTLDQVNRFAPGMARAVVGAYLYELKKSDQNVAQSP